MKRLIFQKKQFVVLIIGIALFTLAINLGYLSNSEASIPPPSPNLQVDVLPVPGNDSPPHVLAWSMTRSDKTISPPEFSVSSSVKNKQDPLSKEARQVAVLRKELDRAREDYLRIQRLVAQEYLTPEDGINARERVMKASKALKTAQFNLEHARFAASAQNSHVHARTADKANK